LIAAGCATARLVETTRYVLDVSVDVPKAATVDQSLGIRTIEPARPYKQKVVYRDAGFVLGSYDIIEWAEMPSDVITRVLTDALIATGRFRDVGDAVNLALPEFMLTGQLRKFDEVHTTDPWTAECEVRLELRGVQDAKAVWAATLSAKEPLERNDTSALPPAMNRAIAKIVQQAAEQIATRK